MDSIGGSVKRLLLTSLAVSLLAITSCGVAKDDIAATINGHEITVAQIRKMSGAKELAQSSAQDPTAAPAQRGTIAGSVARGAVTLLVQRELLAKALSQLGGKVTPVDTSAAEQRTTQMSASIKSFATGYFALDAALLRVAKASLPAPTRADVTAYFDQHAADFRTTCIDVIGVQPSAVAAARAALDSGTSFAQYLAAHPDTTQAVSQSGVSVCIAAGDTQNASILQLIEPMAIGAVNETSTQAGGPTAFIKVTSRSVGTLQDDAVVKQITTALEQTTTAAATKKVQDELVAQQRSAVVKIDPRFGSWDPAGDVPILAPPVPVVKQSATTLPSFTPAS